MWGGTPDPAYTSACRSRPIVYLPREEPRTGRAKESKDPKTQWGRDANCLDGAVGMGEV